MNTIYLKLLKQYSDELIKLQFDSKYPPLDGGIFCPSCKVIHGRSIDAIYGLSVAYKYFKNDKYLNSATKLMKYSDNLICKDGGIYNDLQTTWRYTTVFYVIDLAETLLSSKDVLPYHFVNKIEERLKLHAKWLYENLDENSYTNINYPINNSLALFLAGSYLSNAEYLKQAHHLAKYAMEHISPSSLLFGEGKPHGGKTKRNCLAIDIGYNLEESLPALVKYAYYSKDEKMEKELLKVCRAHLDFILPDGAIDNSLGCRNYKWTYYGSRTCDGIIPMCLIMGKYDNAFKEASYRNTELLEKCSGCGLLFGGPDYQKNGEKACVHHTFEHINAIAFAVANCSDEELACPNVKIPSDFLYDKYYPELDSYRLGNANYLMNVTCYDENISYSGHASGGTLTMLYSRKKGPIIMGSVGDYQLTESTNMQVPLDTEKHRSLLPRFEVKEGRKLFSSSYFTNTKKTNDLSFESGLMTRDGEELLNSSFIYKYKLSDDGLRIEISDCKINAPFVISLIKGDIKILKGELINKEEIFFLTPGFIADEYRILPVKGQIEIELK